MSPSSRQIISEYLDKQFPIINVDLAKKQNKKCKNPLLEQETIEIHTDGGCFPNPNGIGTWAFIVNLNNQELARHSRVSHGSTNNKMELVAATKALEWVRDWPLLKFYYKIIIYTDSKYLINGINSWIHGWQNNGWKSKATGLEIKNRSEWQVLAHVISKQVIWEWVKGHEENVNNNIVDEMCQLARKEALAINLERKNAIIEDNGEVIS